jgi:preprotein translocase subunit SecG
METLLTILHYLICLFLIVVILLQAGKGADIGAAFGAGGSQTVFGPRGAATFLSKLTAVVALLFLATSMGLVAYSRSRTAGSVFEKVPPPAETMPAEPAPAAPPLTTPETQQ